MVDLEGRMIDADNILVESSRRHVHLTQEHVEVLFGPGYTLNQLPEGGLSQPRQYAAEETVKLRYGANVMDNVRVLGGPRGISQVELTTDDARNLGYDDFTHMYALSGADLSKTPGIYIVGPYGEVKLDSNAFIAIPHLHIAIPDAEIIGVTNGQIIAFEYDGKIKDGIRVRIGDQEDVGLSIHIDNVEAKDLGMAYKDDQKKVIKHYCRLVFPTA